MLQQGCFFHDKPPLTSVRSSDFKVHATKQKRGLFFLEGLLPVITWKPGISAGPKVFLKSPVLDSFLKKQDMKFRLVWTDWLFELLAAFNSVNWASQSEIGGA